MANLMEGFAKPTPKLFELLLRDSGSIVELLFVNVRDIVSRPNTHTHTQLVSSVESTAIDDTHTWIVVVWAMQSPAVKHVDNAVANDWQTTPIHIVFHDQYSTSTIQAT
jgi:hypothetical protein